MIKYWIIDGSNIAFYSPEYKNNKKVGKFEFLEKIEEYFNKLCSQNEELKYEIIIDANLRYKIDQRHLLEKAIFDRRIKLCPAGIKADVFIKEMLLEKKDEVGVISNDLFREFPEDLRNVISTWRFPVMFLNGDVVIPRLRELLNSSNNSIKTSLSDKLFMEINY